MLTRNMILTLAYNLVGASHDYCLWKSCSNSNKAWGLYSNMYIFIHGILIEFLTINEVKMMLTLFSVITRENIKGL